MQNNKNPVFLTYLSFIFVIVQFVIIILFHIYRTDHNPLMQTMSEYTIGSFGILLPISLMSFGLSSYLSWIAIRKTLPRTRLTKNGMTAFLIWTIFITVAGIFPTDYITGPYTLSGIIHGVSSYFAFVSLPFSHFYLSLFYRKELKSNFNFYRYQVYFYMSFLGFCIYIISPLGYKGLFQRIYLGFVMITYLDLISIPFRKIDSNN